MRRRTWTALIICCTALAVLLMLRAIEDTPAEARIVAVQRGDVHQVVALTGRLAYADQHYAVAMADGVVTRVYAKERDRVCAGDALVRLEIPGQEAVTSAAVQAEAHAGMNGAASRFEPIPDHTVVRSESDCTVRQLLVQEDVPVTAGTPVARLSSNQQIIVCSVFAADAGLLSPGMWAWIYAEGEPVGFAEVETIGKVTADPSTGLRCAEVRLIPEQHIDMPEHACIDAEVFLAGSDDVLTLPLEAITDRDTVWWVHEGRCTEIPAQIVMADEMHAWVALPEGMRVALGEFIQGQRILEAEE